jgi:hypothetical protein
MSSDVPPNEERGSGCDFPGRSPGAAKSAGCENEYDVQRRMLALSGFEGSRPSPQIQVCGLYLENCTVVERGGFNGGLQPMKVGSGKPVLETPSECEVKASQVSVCRVARGNQATKGTRWMPWRQVPMKDVVSCDKPRGAASERRSGDFRMGQPGRRNGRSPTPESIGCEEGTA